MLTACFTKYFCSFRLRHIPLSCLVIATHLKIKRAVTRSVVLW
ncbi:hypothetical protein CIT292_05919 [Citrobacter youngae ATCC 29220]|uniref:Uncharacterized protein n=1 Tax=Citrobacter youngae ATCC 29220 TaxID=500640 RepID=D4B6I3_9ENTR|nr:hypothetical protein CIT292_05919 [Citrobacter youngae ATCC 29220]